jgi:hypothetical protein
LLSWAQAQGVDTSNVGLFVEEDDQGHEERGILAAQDTPKGDALLVVPMRIALVDAGGGGSDGGPALYPNAPWSVRLASRLLRERLAAERSPWHPYVAALPRTVPAASAWDWDQTRLLADARAEACCDRAAFLREDAFERLRPRAAEVWGCSGEQKDEDETAQQQLRELWGWALGCVHSRTFLVGTRDGRGARALVPLIDLCNHAGDEAVAGGGGEEGGGGARSFGAAARDAAARDNVRWDLVRAGGGEGGGGEPWALALTALRPLVAGEELLLSYGERENTDFLVHYGFLPQLNAHDDVELFGCGSSSSSASAEAAAAAEGAGAGAEATAEEADPSAPSPSRLAVQEALEEAAEWHWALRPGLSNNDEEDEEAAARRYRAAVEAAVEAELEGAGGGGNDGGSLRVKAGSRVSPGLVALFAELEGGPDAQRAAELLVARRCWQLLAAASSSSSEEEEEKAAALSEDDARCRRRPPLLRDLALLAQQEEGGGGDDPRPFSTWLLPYYHRRLVAERGLCREDGAWMVRGSGGGSGETVVSATAATTNPPLAREILGAGGHEATAAGLSYGQRLATTFRAYKGMILADCVLDAGASVADLAG